MKSKTTIDSQMGFRIEMRLIWNLVTSQVILCLAFLKTCMALSSCLLKINIYFLALFSVCRKNVLTIKCCFIHMMCTFTNRKHRREFSFPDQSIFIT